MDMSKFVNISVSASISTDFFIEVPDDASEELIKEKAEKEVVLPHKYPDYINRFLRERFNINVQGIDSMVKSWNLDELEYIIDNGQTSKTSRSE